MPRIAHTSGPVGVQYEEVKQAVTSGVGIEECFARGNDLWSIVAAVPKGRPSGGQAHGSVTGPSEHTRTAEWLREHIAAVLEQLRHRNYATAESSALLMLVPSTLGNLDLSNMTFSANDRCIPHFASMRQLRALDLSATTLLPGALCKLLQSVPLLWCLSLAAWRGAAPAQSSAELAAAHNSSSSISSGSGGGASNSTLGVLAAGSQDWIAAINGLQYLRVLDLGRGHDDQEQGPIGSGSGSGSTSVMLTDVRRLSPATVQRLAPGGLRVAPEVAARLRVTGASWERVLAILRQASAAAAASEAVAEADVVVDEDTVSNLRSKDIKALSEALEIPSRSHKTAEELRAAVADILSKRRNDALLASKLCDDDDSFRRLVADHALAAVCAAEEALAEAGDEAGMAAAQAFYAEAAATRRARLHASVYGHKDSSNSHIAVTPTAPHRSSSSSSSSASAAAASAAVAAALMSPSQDEFTFFSQSPGGIASPPPPATNNNSSNGNNSSSGSGIGGGPVTTGQAALCTPPTATGATALTAAGVASRSADLARFFRGALSGAVNTTEAAAAPHSPLSSTLSSTLQLQLGSPSTTGGSPALSDSGGGNSLLLDADADAEADVDVTATATPDAAASAAASAASGRLGLEFVSPLSTGALSVHLSSPAGDRGLVVDDNDDNDNDEDEEEGAVRATLPASAFSATQQATQQATQADSAAADSQHAHASGSGSGRGLRGVEDELQQEAGGSQRSQRSHGSRRSFGSGGDGGIALSFTLPYSLDSQSQSQGTQAAQGPDGASHIGHAAASSAAVSSAEAATQPAAHLGPRPVDTLLPTLPADMVDADEGSGAGAAAAALGPVTARPAAVTVTAPPPLPPTQLLLPVMTPTQDTHDVVYTPLARVLVFPAASPSSDFGASGSAGAGSGVSPITSMPPPLSLPSPAAAISSAAATPVATAHDGGLLHNAPERPHKLKHQSVVAAYRARAGSGASSPASTAPAVEDEEDQEEGRLRPALPTAAITPAPAARRSASGSAASVASAASSAVRSSAVRTPAPFPQPLLGLSLAPSLPPTALLEASRSAHRARGGAGASVLAQLAQQAAAAAAGHAVPFTPYYDSRSVAATPTGTGTGTGGKASGRSGQPSSAASTPIGSLQQVATRLRYDEAEAEADGEEGQGEAAGEAEAGGARLVAEGHMTPTLTASTPAAAPPRLTGRKRRLSELDGGADGGDGEGEGAPATPRSGTGNGNGTGNAAGPQVLSSSRYLASSQTRLGIGSNNPASKRARQMALMTAVAADRGGSRRVTAEQLEEAVQQLQRQVNTPLPTTTATPTPTATPSTPAINGLGSLSRPHQQQQQAQYATPGPIPFSLEAATATANRTASSASGVSNLMPPSRLSMMMAAPTWSARKGTAALEARAAKEMAAATAKAPPAPSPAVLHGVAMTASSGGATPSAASASTAASASAASAAAAAAGGTGLERLIALSRSRPQLLTEACTRLLLVNSLRVAVPAVVAAVARTPGGPLPYKARRIASGIASGIELDAAPFAAGLPLAAAWLPAGHAKLPRITLPCDGRGQVALGDSYAALHGFLRVALRAVHSALDEEEKAAVDTQRGVIALGFKAYNELIAEYKRLKQRLADMGALPPRASASSSSSSGHGGGSTSSRALSRAAQAAAAIAAAAAELPSASHQPQQHHAAESASVPVSAAVVEGEGEGTGAEADMQDVAAAAAAKEQEQGNDEMTQLIS